MLALQSCSSLLKPYEVGKETGIYELPCSSPTCNRLAEASGLAVKLQSNYIEAAGHDETVRNFANASLTAAATYALLLGVSDGIGPANASDQITALGAASAATLGVTSIYTNPVRQQIFIQGARAVSCARVAAVPFELGTTDLARLNAVLDGTGTPPTTDSLYDHIANVEMFLDLFEQAGLPADYIASVRNEVAAARAAVSRGFAVRREITRTAPSRLMNHLRAVDTEVAAQLQATTVDLNTGLQIRSNLQSSAAAIAPQFGTQKQTPPDPAIAPALAGGIAALAAGGVNYDRVLREMRHATEFLNTLANDIEHTAKSVDTTFAACEFEPVSLALRLNTNTLEIPIGKSKSFLVSEGQPPFVAEMVTSGSDIDVKFVPAFGNRGSVEVGAGATAGDYEVSVYDRTNKPVTLTVTVK